MLIEHGNELSSNNKLHITQVSSETVKEITWSEGKRRLSKIKLKKKISQEGRKIRQKDMTGSIQKFICKGSTFCGVCLIGVCIVSQDHDPPSRGFGLDMFLSNIHQRLWEAGALTVLPRMKQGDFRFSEATGQRWELQHDEN